MSEIKLGEYYVISPYHKTRKKLPFVIHWKNCDNTYHVSTVEYKGWKRIPVYGDYSEQSILGLIKDKIIKNS